MLFRSVSVGTVTVTATALGLTGTATVTVVPGAPDPFRSTASLSPSTMLAGGTATVTVTVRDALGNIITNATPSMFNAYAFGGTLGAFTCTNGVCTATYTAPTVPGTYPIPVAMNGTAVTGSQLNATVQPGAAKLVITGTGTQNAGASQTITITAYDANGNVVTGYTGAKSLTFSGANVSPNNTSPRIGATNFGAATSVTFTNGVATASMTLFKAETAVIATTDGTIAAAGADRLTVVVSAGAAAKAAEAATNWRRESDIAKS